MAGNNNPQGQKKKAKKKRTKRGGGISPPVWMERFLKLISEAQTVTHSAEVAGTCYNTVYKYRHEKYPEGHDKEGEFKNVEFREAYDAAYAMGTELLEQEAQRRAVEGVDHPVIHQGEITDTYKKHSDTLLMFLLKSRDPKFKDRTEITGADGKDLIPAKIVVEHV